MLVGLAINWWRSDAYLEGTAMPTDNLVPAGTGLQTDRKGQIT